MASGPSLNLAVYMAGLLIYCYVLLVPLVFLGLKGFRDWVLKYWVLLCVGIVLIEMLFPNVPLYYWNRWVYLLVYPLLFFVVQGLGRLWRFVPNAKAKSNACFQKFLL